MNCDNSDYASLSTPRFAPTSSLKLIRAEGRRHHPGCPSTLIRATAYTAPAVVSLVLFILLLGVHHDMGRLRTSLDWCGGGGPHWANNPAGVPVVTTVMATVVSSCPTGPEWDSDSESRAAAAASDVPGRSMPMSVTMIDVTSQHSTDPLTHKKPGPDPTPSLG
ncbi:hypothetical protein DFH94DRAFT_798316 [Russula ochroleuca]|uniref:Uncharacterized protein n=1 Tax=Russula ochroleuca TaxID=152965 RepID=A0A9P5N873_9AGAM|nr:hypothetical protein DFH94DRAFT_798316 [Russula ochroleuca]